MSADDLLSRLDRVKRTGPDRWIASCPTRDDKHPSMTIRALPDGRVLLHDFGGDSVDEILAALGMNMSDLFPPRPLLDGRKPERNPFSAADALRCLVFEAKLVYLAALETLEGKALSDADFERLALAVERIEAAEGVVWTTH
ncbi:MAG: DNA primase [Betaproteobacteria bacterium]|nr:DNA primase [Betaproteobacteria bacterium]